MNSAIYTGNIFHQRFHPVEHHFNYKIFMAYIDLDEIDSLMPQSFFWGINRPALISFFGKDYLSKGQLDLRSAVKKLVFERTGKDVQGPIRLLAHLRYFGYCFNPVSFYYCFDKVGEKNGLEDVNKLQNDLDKYNFELDEVLYLFDHV